MLKFTNWVKWASRGQLGNALDEQGLYMLAHLLDEPYQIETMVPEIIYIGLAGKKGSGQKKLRERLHQFNVAANGGSAPHSGGKKYYRQFGGIQSYLYVTVNPVTHITGIEKACYLLMMERILIWRYVRKFGGQRPICNSE